MWMVIDTWEEGSNKLTAIGVFSSAERANAVAAERLAALSDSYSLQEVQVIELVDGTMEVIGSLSTF